MRRILVSTIFVLAVFSLFASSPSEANWNKAGFFAERVNCGFFYNEKLGMLGSGYRLQGADRARIFLTSDGGISWKPAITPSVIGAVTSIQILPNGTGYASLFCVSDFATLWKTKDSGRSWIDWSPHGINEATSVAANGDTLILTTWDGGTGLSFDGGRSWDFNRTPTGPSETNMALFYQTTSAVIVSGPQQNGTTLNPADLSNNNAHSWNMSGSIPEAWSVYATESGSLFVAGEGGQNYPSHSVYSSTNFGQTWQEIYRFRNPTIDLTGHIAGFANTLYIQAQTPTAGLYRSDDLGKSWHSIGGPSDGRDSRFVVTGCAGQVVYAFDTLGNVWKTTDGGDGTLAIGATALTVSLDTVSLRTKACRGVAGGFAVTSQCGSVTVDSIAFGALSISARDLPLSTIANAFDSIRLDYAPHSIQDTTITTTIYSHDLSGALQTKISLHLVNLADNEVHVPPSASGKIGDTVRIPVYCTTEFSSTSSIHIAGSTNSDVLTLIAVDQAGTLTDGGSATIAGSGDKFYVDLQPSGTITLQQSDALPLVFLRFRVTLAKTMQAFLTIDTVLLQSIAKHYSFAPCDQPVTSFDVIPLCGDSLLSHYMASNKIVFSIAERADDLILHYVGLTAGTASIEVYSVNGTVVKRFAVPIELGPNEARYSLQGLPESEYFAVLREDGRVIRMIRFLK